MLVGHAHPTFARFEATATGICITMIAARLGYNPYTQKS